jgi:hypothetical protein
MSKLTLAALAQQIEELRAQSAVTVLDLANEISDLREEVAALNAQLAARPQVATSRMPGSYETRRAAAQRLAARFPERRGFTLDEVLAEVANA